MVDVHCDECGRYLCKADSKVEIKCPKCKKVNKIVVTSYTKMLTATPEEDTITT